MKCQFEAKNKHQLVVCDNTSCAKTFEKSQNQLSVYNFCSRSCAVTTNNSKSPKRIARLGNCSYCKTELKGRRKYCSNKCSLEARTLTKEKILIALRNCAKQLGRPPTRREFRHVDVSYKLFGSWNNALVAAGLTPNRSLSQRMYKRSLCVAKDGHKCNSISELIIDNWLFAHNISHVKEATYPEGKFTADWMVDSRVLVEYLGLEKDSKRYDSTTEKKRKICKKFGLQLVEIHPKDLFPKNNLESVFLLQHTSG